MTVRLKKTALSGALVLLFLIAAPAAVAAPVTVNLRVEGIADTIFDGPVVTDAHQTTTPSDGVARPCDGTNSGGAPTPLFSAYSDWLDQTSAPPRSTPTARSI